MKLSDVKNSHNKVLSKMKNVLTVSYQINADHKQMLSSYLTYLTIIPRLLLGHHKSFLLTPKRNASAGFCNNYKQLNIFFGFQIRLNNYKILLLSSKQKDYLFGTS